jgi:hypothetical protein
MEDSGWGDGETTDSPSPKPGSRGCVRPILMLGCGSLSVLFLAVVLSLLFVPREAWYFAYAWRDFSGFRTERDRLVSRALANGNADTAYRRAHERFRRAYTAEQLADYLRDRSALLHPPATSMSLVGGSINGIGFISTTIEAAEKRYTIYATRDSDGYHLLGVSPGLDRAVQGDNRESSGSIDKNAAPG